MEQGAFTIYQEFDCGIGIGEAFPEQLNVAPASILTLDSSIARFQSIDGRLRAGLIAVDAQDAIVDSHLACSNRRPVGRGSPAYDQHLEIFSPHQHKARDRLSQGQGHAESAAEAEQEHDEHGDRQDAAIRV